MTLSQVWDRLCAECVLKIQHGIAHLNVRYVASSDTLAPGVAIAHVGQRNHITDYLIAFCFLLTPLQQGIPL